METTGWAVAWARYIPTALVALALGATGFIVGAGSIADPAAITAVATVVLALGVAVAWIQIRADHDRSRRQNAIDRGADWVHAQDARFGYALRIASALDRQAAQALYQYPGLLALATPYRIRIDEPMLPYLFVLFSEVKEERQTAGSSGPVELSDEQALELRRILIAYLNELEIVMSAWKHNVLDRSMIEEQFRFIMTAGYEFIAQEFFVVAGDSNYPGVSRFVEVMKARAQPKEGKGPVA